MTFHQELGASIPRPCLTARGGLVAAHPRDAAALASMATSVRVAGARVETLAADVAEEATAGGRLRTARVGALDVLVSNAEPPGKGGPAEFANSIDEQRAVLTKAAKDLGITQK